MQADDKSMVRPLRLEAHQRQARGKMRDIPEFPDHDDSARAEAARHAPARTRMDSIHVRLKDGTQLPLPKAVTPILVRLLTEMARGNAVTLTPVPADMTTQEAANLLNIGHARLIGLLEDGQIPFGQTGAHRRIKLTDLQAYQERSRKARAHVLDELAAQAQLLRMGY
jgi:excisionase family DNA binding protein